ncbi:MAG: prenyltransferase/squalene oxidase repeat-containing protein [Candidatus Aminicenantales bacterium]|jgi:hypothetical protein
MISAPENATLTKRLTSLILPGGGIPYYKGGGPSAEPTHLALLALWASGAGGELTRPLLSWAAGLQNPDGSVALNPEHRDQGLWLTALSAIVFHRLGLKEARDRALGFVASLKSVTVANDPKIRQDNTLTGWPWVRGTFGWVEPTAWSVVALNVTGLGSDPRAIEGLKFLLDRQIPSGGWNYGNPGLNDRELLPFWDTTGLALIALHEQTDMTGVRASLEFLERSQEKIESPCGLAWAALSLETYGRDTARLKQRLLGLLNSLPDDGLNAAHFAAGLIALSGKKVFIP